MADLKLKALVNGLDTLSADEETALDSLRVAKNIDLSDKGKVSSAPSVKLLAPGNYHSLYVDAGVMLAADGNVLKRINRSTGATNVVMTLPGYGRVAYCRLMDRVAFTSGERIWSVGVDDEALPVGLDTPSTPILSNTAIGGLDPGRYGVAIAAVSETNESSGLSPAAFIDVPEGHGISLAMPVASAETVWFDVYRTSHNGDKLYWSMRVPAGLSTAVAGKTHLGVAADTQFLDRMPAGKILRHWNGRLLSACGNTLWFSEPLRYGLTSRRHNFVQFSHEITMLQGTDGGIFVGTGKGEVYFLAGSDPATMEVRRTGGRASIPLASAEIDLAELNPSLQNIGSGRGAIWLAENGFVVGLPSGTLLEAQRNRIHALKGEAGGIAVLDKRVRATTRLSPWVFHPH